jgi:hypothetical protein
MKKISVLFLFVLIISACSRGGPSPTEAVANQLPTIRPTATQPQPTASPVPPTETATPIITPTATATQTYPEEGFGPTNFPADVNPLTGLFVTNSNSLEKRPVAVKVNVVPRSSTRPPWGLSNADIVFDYYQNNGYTRFHTIFLGQETELAGPIRSARFPDHFLIRMYKSIFAYGSADPTINARLFGSEYSDRLVLEGGGSGLCPPTVQAPMCRYDPQGYSHLLGGTSEIRGYAQNQGVDNSRQNLDGMYFNLEAPSGGERAETINIRYSSDSYSQWDYDSSSGKYLRYQDDSFDLGEGETFAPLIDRNNEEQVSADNVVVVFMEHSYFRRPPAEIIDILVSGSGPAYAFRDGEMFEVRWNIPATDSVLYLTYPDGTRFPYKPGNTWYQVIGNSSSVLETANGAWRFEFLIP